MFKLFGVIFFLAGGSPIDPTGPNPSQKCNPRFNVTTEAGGEYRLGARQSAGNTNMVEFFVEEEKTGKILTTINC